jgi:lysozyme
MNKKIISILISAMFCVATFFMPVNVHAQSIYKGVDIYEYDNIYDYQQLKNDGIDVVIQKATQGLYHNDSLLFYRYTQIINYGFKIGYYHFADNSGQPIAEAQHFLGQINRLHSDTILWLDIENASNWTQSESVDYVNQFVNYVRSQGYNIGIYTGLSFYYEYLSGNIPTDIPLWLAGYRDTRFFRLPGKRCSADGSV